MALSVPPRKLLQGNNEAASNDFDE